MRNLFEAEWTERAKRVPFPEKNGKWVGRPERDWPNRRFNQVKGRDILRAKFP